VAVPDASPPAGQRGDSGDASEHPDLAGRHVLLVVAGGVAAYKAAALARELVKAGASVQPVLTEGATAFVGEATFAALTGRSVPPALFDRPEEITHVRLARAADVAIFAPATANLMAKLAVGLADDLATSTAACLTCPTVVAPAMHTEMWQQPATQANAATLTRRGVRLVGPEHGELAGGDAGPGRFAEVETILAAAAEALGRARRAPAEATLAKRTVVVTAGGTREPIDPVRYIGNRSSGKMGYALAEAAARRGATVELVAGATTLAEPAGVAVHPVETASAMRQAVLDRAETADVVVKAAAVADFRPEHPAEEKIKKGETAPASIPLAPTPDILAELGAMDRRGVLVGFAAETELSEAAARQKLADKGADLLFANPVSVADSGFEADSNRGLLVAHDGSMTELGQVGKAELAERIWDRVEQLLAQRVP
jgi:phosphopantothenoylcysteine decarboxylase/phosphopantothenate--cysteine ligase